MKIISSTVLNALSKTEINEASKLIEFNNENV